MLYHHPDELARKQMLTQHSNKVSTSTPKPLINKNNAGDLSIDTIPIKKLHPEAQIPTKANSSDAGFDLYALESMVLPRQYHKLVKTGIAIAIPEGCVGLIWPRSGLSYKHGLDVLAGVIDAGYRGEVGVILYNTQYGDYRIDRGDRIAQLVIQKVENFSMIEVSELETSERNKGGFGSSGS